MCQPGFAPRMVSQKIRQWSVLVVPVLYSSLFWPILRRAQRRDAGKRASNGFSGVSDRAHQAMKKRKPFGLPPFIGPQADALQS